MNKTTKTLFIIVLLGFALRAGFFLAVRPWDPGVLARQILIDDAAGYHAIAEGLVQTRTFVNDPAVSRTPGYPLFLAFIYALFGAHPWIALLLQVVMNTAAILLVYRLARRYFPETTALLTAFLYAVEPHVVMYCSYLLTETLFSAMILLVIYTFAAGLQERRPSLLAFSGLLTGLATMVRPISQFLPAAMLLIFAFHFRRNITAAFRPAVLFFAFFAVAVFPWGLRNYTRYGDFSLSTIGALNLLYYNAAYTEHSRTGKELSVISTEFAEKEKALLKEGETNPFAIAHARKKTAFAYIREYPLPYLLSHIRGTVNMFINLTASQTCAMLGIRKVEKPYDFMAFTSYLQMVRWFFTYKNLYEIGIGLIIAAFLFFVYCTAVAGVLALLREGKYDFLFLAGILIAYFALLPGVVGVSRFKLPFIPLYLTLTAEGLRRCLTRGKLQSGL